MFSDANPPELPDPPQPPVAPGRVLSGSSRETGPPISPLKLRPNVTICRAFAPNASLTVRHSKSDLLSVENACEDPSPRCYVAHPKPWSNTTLNFL
eukprot:scaffold1347_cov350-Pavlova_lutheri.AAC.36